MQINETLSDGLKRGLTVTIPASELGSRLSERLDQLKDRVRIKGFRPGKVPVSHLRRVYGKAAMAEIVTQADEFITEFMALLTITPSSHGATYRVLHIANLVGVFGVMYYKDLRKRPRPSHVIPALLPPIPVPGHAAWPSGQAFAV